MPAAQLCRAYCTRLRPSVTWSRRTSLALRQTPTTFRAIGSMAVAFGSNEQTSLTPQLYRDGASSRQFDPSDASQNHSEAAPPAPQKRPRLNLARALSRSPDTRAATPRRPRRSPPHSASPDKSRRTKSAGPRVVAKSKRPLTKRALQKRARAAPKKSESELLAEKQIQRRLAERYAQWGWLRHQSVEEELWKSRQGFRIWERKLESMVNPNSEPSKWPWRDDGKFLFELESVPAMRRVWEDLDLETRQEKWPKIMQSTMFFRPDKAIQVLDATLNPLPPGYAINDVLRAIIKKLDLSQYSTHRERILKAEEVLDIFSKIIEDLPKGHVPLRQGDIGDLCQKLPSDQVEELYRILKRNDFHLHYNTLLHIASSLATHSTTKDIAFKILQEVADQGVDLNRSHCSSVITTLLHTAHGGDSKKSEGAFSPQRALEYFIEKGHTPNIINFTALLQTFCLQGDVAEAIRLPLLLAETGVELDARCVATVFRGAKDSHKVEHIKGALEVAKAANAPYVDVLNNALHSIFYFAELESREKGFEAPWVTPVFGRMLRIYAKKFSLEPLQALIPDLLPLVLAHEHPDGTEKFRAGPTRNWQFKDDIVPLVDEFFSSGPDGKVQPNNTTISIMLRAYIKSLHRPHDLLSFYAFYKSRLEEARENPLVKLIKPQNSIVHDTLIMVMCEKGRLTRAALQVFGDMLKGIVRQEPDEPDKDGEIVIQAAPAHPAPSLFTFNILLHGLFLRGYTNIAEQVLQVMKEHNLQPTHITWNTLASGYAKMQNLSQTVGTLQDLEAAGFKPDVHTFKAFSRLRDQNRALQRMEQIIDANKKSFEEDLGQPM